ncbi:hypothetical protein ACMFAW_21650 [Citrobacter koseri]|uniref:hypothetical protein n=1 Tax=Citrobacter koseri TaxID=545 RepID=UPI0025993DD4|nr:hypothetical protein [uncultured Citrobacter sp.]
MKWLLAACCLAAFPALAVYQPTESELKLIQVNREGLEKNLKNALPLQSKVDICIGYLKNSGLLRDEAGHATESYKTLDYWNIVKHYVDLSVKYADNRFPRLYYYDQKLYEKFGPYPKDNASISKIFDAAVDSDYLNIKHYASVSQQFAESLRKKDLNKICVESVTKGMRGQLFPATASMDKLFYPGITSDNTGEKDAEYWGQAAEHRQFTQLLNQIEASYY